MGTSRLLASALLLVLATGCERGGRDSAERPSGVDTLSDRDMPAVSGEYEGECGPCACSDDECYDSLQRANNPQQARGLLAAPKTASVTSLAAAAVSYSADTSMYRVKWALSKGLPAGDTLYVRFRRDSAAGVMPLNTLRRSRAQRDSADFKANKIFGKVATYRVIAQVRKGTTVKAERSVTWQTNLPAPVDTTPPDIDTLVVDSTLAIMKLDVKPDSVKVFVKNDSASKYPYTQQFCPFVVFADGKVTLPRSYMTLQPCIGEYDKIPLAVKTVSDKQQARADSACIKWEATGGTITASTCGGVPS